MESPGNTSRSGRVVKRSQRSEDFYYGDEDEGLRNLRASAAAIGRAARPAAHKTGINQSSDDNQTNRKISDSYSDGGQPKLSSAATDPVTSDDELDVESSEEQFPKKLSAYQLWSKEARADLLKRNPHLDSSQIMRILGQQWESLQGQEKSYWKMLAKKQSDSLPPLSARTSSRGRGRPKGSVNSLFGKKTRVVPSFDVNGSSFLESAAYLNLLGQGLNSIGERLKEHQEEPVSQERLNGFLSVLLDSALCSMATLISLTQYIDELEDAIPANSREKTLNNISYIMPGAI
ncbi:uncharacterized protein LOC136028432 isoform X2 [Artemia franciscana]|uniref:HMG box domain-containing protein n=1 Tax=Artemia franciscana TaxID=6661 RepID=A0AA88IF34_ARTSF|nr:hypothetical protein QYM36_008115 [Artemia franciscana]